MTITIGNSWLGSLQVSAIAQTTELSGGAFSMTSPILSVASTLDRITVQLASTTETMTIALVPVAGTEYSTICFQTSTSGHSSFFWQPDRPLFLAAGDQVKVDVSNGDLTGVVYGGMIILY